MAKEAPRTVLFLKVYEVCRLGVRSCLGGSGRIEAGRFPLTPDVRIDGRDVLVPAFGLCPNKITEDREIDAIPLLPTVTSFII